MIVPLEQAIAGFGNKAAGLAQVLDRVPVPAGVAIAGTDLLALLTSSQQADLARWLTAPQDHLRELSHLTGSIRWTTAGRTELAAALAGLAGRFVVRSSSADEDAESSSFAGVFDSLIDVSADEVADAVLAVWRSGYTEQALLAYGRAGRVPTPDHLSVLVQRAVSPTTAGVAFTDTDGGGYLEWVAGHGRHLVDGTATPAREHLDTRTEGWRGKLARWLRQLPGSDVEWAYDGDTIWIVQVRPRTAELPTVSHHGVRTTALYEGDRHEGDLGRIGADYHRIRAKRRLPRAIALAQGARVPDGWLVHWDGSPAGLAEWAATLPDEVVVDAAADERQHIVGRSELPALLTRLATGRSSFTFLCRAYLKGDLALLSTVNADGEVYVEASTEGLLAVNRGFGSARPLSAAAQLELLGASQAAALIATTREQAHRLHPRATCEWVVAANTLYFVDYSAPTGTAVPAFTDGRVLSPGAVRGRVQHLQIDETLTETSIAPIISISEQVSPETSRTLLGQLRDRLDLTDTDASSVIVAAARPMAVLSMLIGQVAGFLFEEGAVLSHLGILLRESGVPAAIVGTGNLPADGTEIDLIHGAVIATT